MSCEDASLLNGKLLHDVLAMRSLPSLLVAAVFWLAVFFMAIRPDKFNSMSTYLQFAWRSYTDEYRLRCSRRADFPTNADFGGQVLSYYGKDGSGWKAGKESTPIATPFISGWGVTGKFHPASNVRIRIGKSRIETIPRHMHSSVLV